MADFYPLLVRAISGLPQNTADARKAVYDRARAALLKQLRSVSPPLPEGEILRERQSLEDAIRRIEADQPTEAPPLDETEAAAESGSDLPRPSPTRVGTPLPPRNEARPGGADIKSDSGKLDPAKTGGFKSDGTKADGASADDGQAGDLKASAAKPGQAPFGETRSAGDGKAASARSGSPFPPPPAPADADAVDEDVDPTITRPKVGTAKPAAERQDRQERPRVPVEREAAGGPRWQRTAIAIVLIAVLLAGGAYAVVNRETLFGGAQHASAPAQTEPVAEAPKPDQPKSADRVTQSGAAPAARPAAPPPRQGATSAQRAYLFEEAAGGAQGLQTYEGTVTWRTETFNAGPGLPPDVGIRADIQIPGRLGAVFTLRRNSDAALPASHTIDINFTLPSDFAYGGISNVPGIRMKQTESAQGAPLAGLSVRVNPTYFLIGLSAVPVDRDRNLQLLQSRPWIDIPVVYANNKRAILAFEKGPAGTQAFKDAFSAWGELLPEAPPPMTAPANGAN